jgi:hypothetical protein
VIAGPTPADGALAPTALDLARAERSEAAALSGHQQAEAVLVAPAGIVVLCGVAPEQGGERSGLICLDDTGELRWAALLAAGHGAGRALVAMPAGGYAIAGEVAAGSLALRGRLLRTDAKGTVVVSATFGSAGVTGFAALAVLGDGGLVAGGMDAGAGWLLAVDTALRSRWERPLADLGQVRALRATRDGGFVAAAIREPSTTTLGMTTAAAFDGDGAPRWQRALPAAGRAEPAALAVLGDGGFVVVGHLAAEREHARCWVQKLDAAGAPQWQRLLGASDEERRGRAVVALADGGVVVASDALRLGERAIHVARLDAAGDLRWERRHGGGARAQDVARGMAATADGGFVVVGSTLSAASGKRCACVLRLEGDGSLRWKRAFAAQQEPAAIA